MYKIHHIEEKNASPLAIPFVRCKEIRKKKKRGRKGE